MLADVLDRKTVSDTLQAVETALRQNRDQVTTRAASEEDVDPAAAADAAERLAAHFGRRSREAPAAAPSPVPEVETQLAFISRDPIASLAQTAIEQRLRADGSAVLTAPPAAGDVPTTREALVPGVQFGPHDVRWGTEIAKAVVARIAMGTHRFNPVPAQHTLAANARVVLVGDWGTGLPRARTIASQMASEIGSAQAAGREVAVVHLGDVYYSGDPGEYRDRVLAAGCWPVAPGAQGSRLTSWSLNGNHDMYSGGHGYFQTLLGDSRFARQRSADGQPTSLVRLSTPDWDLVGIDTAWNDDVFSRGTVASFEPAQQAVLQNIAGDGRKLIVLSHHQLFSVYEPEDIGPTLQSGVQGLLDAGRIRAWLWGHEHRGMTFKPNGKVPFAACTGHGGVPMVAKDPGTPTPAPGDWEYRTTFDSGGTTWKRFGFVVLDLAGPEVTVRYRGEVEPGDVFSTTLS